MNSSNLIMLGAAAQKRYNMKDNFSIMSVPSDVKSYRIAIAPEYTFEGDYSTPIDYDDILLEKFVFANLEYGRCGYSSKANILLISE